MSTTLSLTVFTAVILLVLTTHSLCLLLQNLIIALVSVAFATLPTLAGLFPLWLTVTLHEGSTLLVALNSLRLLLLAPQASGSSKLAAAVQVAQGLSNTDEGSLANAATAGQAGVGHAGYNDQGKSISHEITADGDGRSDDEDADWMPTPSSSGVVLSSHDTRFDDYDGGRCSCKDHDHPEHNHQPAAASADLHRSGVPSAGKGPLELQLESESETSINNIKFR